MSGKRWEVQGRKAKGRKVKDRESKGEDDAGREGEIPEYRGADNVATDDIRVAQSVVTIHIRGCLCCAQGL